MKPQLHEQFHPENDERNIALNFLIKMQVM